MFEAPTVRHQPWTHANWGTTQRVLLFSTCFEKYPLQKNSEVKNRTLSFRKPFKHLQRILSIIHFSTHSLPFPQVFFGSWMIPDHVHLNFCEPRLKHIDRRLSWSSESQGSKRLRMWRQRHWAKALSPHPALPLHLSLCLSQNADKLCLKYHESMPSKSLPCETSATLTPPKTLREWHE